jgi:sterol desaturase/sphingolipid hydroxylase (fatty acid hydroxylase superfamily)
LGIKDVWDLILALAAFALVFVLSLRVSSLRESMRRRTMRQWLIDGLGLFVQGWLVPLAKVFGILSILRLTLGEFEGSWHLPSWLSFILAFVGVDYLYYWNHRLLHGQGLWAWHRLHHSAQNLDLFASARNSLLTPLLLVYIWLHSFMAFMLADPTAYVLGATLTACLDLWRHSPGLEGGEQWNRRLSWLFITPVDHSWHHSMPGMQKNFGANLSLWDRLHGTYEQAHSQKIPYGWKEQSSLMRQLLFPWIKRGVSSHV